MSTEQVVLCPICRWDRIVTRLHHGACWKHGTLWRAALGIYADSKKPKDPA